MCPLWQQRRKCFCRRRLTDRLVWPFCHGRVALTNQTMTSPTSRLLLLLPTSPTSRLLLLLPLRAAAAAADKAAEDKATIAASQRSSGNAVELPLTASAVAAEAADKATIAASRRNMGDARVAVELPLKARAAAEAHPLRKASDVVATAAVRESLKEAVAADSQRPSQRPQSPFDGAGRAPPQRVASS